MRTSRLMVCLPACLALYGGCFGPRVNLPIALPEVAPAPAAESSVAFVETAGDEAAESTMALVGAGETPAVDAPATQTPETIPAGEFAADQAAAAINADLQLSPQAIPPEPPLTLDLFAALETSLYQNPDLVALRRAEGVSLGALGVARAYPFNPFLQVQVTPWQDAKVGGPGSTYHYVLLMQTLQLGGQQRFREDAAAAALAGVRWNIVQAELQNVAQTQRLFFAALYQRGLRDVARANAAMNDELLAILQKRLAAGDAAAADVAIVRLDDRAARQQARLAEAAYETALLDLRRQLNLPGQAKFDVTGELTDWQWLPTPGDEAADDASSNANAEAPDTLDLAAFRPDVLAARADLAAARANAGVARGNRIPDWQLGPYYQRGNDGTYFYGFRAHADLPVWNNGRPLVRQREAEVAQRYTTWQQLQIRAQLEGEAALERYRRARRMNAEFHAEAGPATGDTLPAELKRLEEQFRANEVDILRMVTARTSLLQVRRSQLDLLNELAQSAAALTAATGLPPETLIRLNAE